MAWDWHAPETGDASYTEEITLPPMGLGVEPELPPAHSTISTSSSCSSLSPPPFEAIDVENAENEFAPPPGAEEAAIDLQSKFTPLEQAHISHRD